MPDEKHTIRDSKGNTYKIIVRRDQRLSKSARWTREPDGSILLRVPHRTPKWQIEPMLKDVAKSLERQMQQRAARSARSDADLKDRADTINRTCYDGKIQYAAIKWVGNMEKRLGSCTTGGATDGHIRISERIKDWPQWVIDYVIAHELAHRVHPNHSEAFWALLHEAYPLTERARGFIQGHGFARGEVLEEDAD